MGEQPIPDTLIRVQGRWRRLTDGKIMGQIRGKQVIWDPSFQQIPSKLIVLSNGDLELEVGAQRHLAHYSDQCIQWADGEIWVMATDSPDLNEKASCRETRASERSQQQSKP